MMNFRDFWGRLDDRMGREVDASGVGWVRLVIGAALLTSISYSWYLGEIYDRYIYPVFYFKYPFFLSATNAPQFGIIAETRAAMHRSKGRNKLRSFSP